MATRARLVVGNPTGHEDQYVGTLAWEHYLLRGHMSLSAWRRLRDTLATGCRATDVEFAVSIPERRRNETTSK